MLFDKHDKHCIVCSVMHKTELQNDCSLAILSRIKVKTESRLQVHNSTRLHLIPGEFA